MTTSSSQFTLDPALAALRSSLPDATILATALASSTKRGREGIARLWLSEGVPFAFSTCPALYEELRAWLAGQIGVHPKEITLVGSGRVGYSLVPRSFGRPFQGKSDLDFVVVSSRLFLLAEGVFAAFADDLKKGVIAPRHETESLYWKENLEFAKRNAPLGFLDANKVPTLNRYPAAQRLNNSMALLVRRLDATKDAPKVRKASLRVYKDWPSFIERLSFNLFDLGNRLTARG
jgi:hypothetical protein